MPVNLSKEYWRALQVSLAFQIFFGLFSALCLDGGQMLQWWAVTMLAYWVGLGLVVIRRPQEPTDFDLFLIRWSFPVLCFLVTPFAAMGIWKLRGV
jgi:hypothetical protein